MKFFHHSKRKHKIIFDEIPSVFGTLIFWYFHYWITQLVSFQLVKFFMDSTVGKAALLNTVGTEINSTPSFLIGEQIVMWKTRIAFFHFFNFRLEKIAPFLMGYLNIFLSLKNVKNSTNWEKLNQKNWIKKLYHPRNKATNWGINFTNRGKNFTTWGYKVYPEE